MSSKPDGKDAAQQQDDGAGSQDTAPTNAELDARVSALDSKLDTILDKLGGTEGKARDTAAQHTEDRLDRPTSIADEIRRQLDDQRKADDAKAAADSDAAWRKGVDEKLAGMAEAVPEPPVRRVEKIMGWRG